MKHIFLAFALFLTACHKENTHTTPKATKSPLSAYAAMATGPITARTEEIAATNVEYTPDMLVGKWRLAVMTNQFYQTNTNADPCWADDYMDIKQFYYGNTIDAPVTLSQGDCIQVPWKQQNIDFWVRYIGNSMYDFSGDTVRGEVVLNRLRLYRDENPEENRTFLYYELVK